MLDTHFRTGSPIWIDLGSPDTEAAAAFYGAVFGWRFVSAGPEAGGYGFFQKDGKTVAALGPLTEEGARSAWTTYFRSDDIDDAARQVVADGGSVRVEPMSVGEGRLAQFTDPQGAQFAVLQSAMGLQKASEDDTLVWVELHAADPEAAIRFYHGLFGWRSQEMQAPGMTYRVLSIAYGDQQQGSFGGVAQLQGEQDEARWVPYFAVADADAVVTAVQDNGGTVRMPAADVPDVGRIAWLEDPGEAVFAVLKPNPRQD
ncbi:hydroxylase [Streptomyces cellostaticus]|uniref:Hydroxylase n=1 Tax=Streptomyces cellostaticus TaxID=67285 RepID=A0A101NKZ9_9ACTN|nr:VOC family protein [Streptomyces cellostaticus]KUM95200.1 hydroxylase [Streptomyces cellostaticus]GHI02076.1 hydroxylase [Streptomyces cellostaticus]